MVRKWKWSLLASKRVLPWCHKGSIVGFSPTICTCLSETNVMAEDVNGVSKRPVDQELETLHVKEGGVQCNLPDPHLMLLDGSDAMTELAMHRGSALMSFRRLDMRSGRQVSSSDEADAWSELGLAQRHSDTRRAFACASMLGTIQAASNLVVGVALSIALQGGCAGGCVCACVRGVHAVPPVWRVRMRVAGRYVFAVWCFGRW